MKIHQILSFFRDEKAALCSMSEQIVQITERNPSGSWNLRHLLFYAHKYQDGFISKNKPVI